MSVHSPGNQHGLCATCFNNLPTAGQRRADQLQEQEDFARQVQEQEQRNARLVAECEQLAAALAGGDNRHALRVVQLIAAAMADADNRDVLQVEQLLELRGIHVLLR